eukprot:SAG31_NODE_30869_length_375_cov_0.735507_1_plen_30_part_10
MPRCSIDRMAWTIFGQRRCSTRQQLIYGIK